MLIKHYSHFFIYIIKGGEKMKILKFTIIFCLCMFLTSNIILGSEIEKPVPPVVPTELTE